jgi:subtilisin family serine protease
MAAASHGINEPGVDYSHRDKIEIKGQFAVRFADHVNLNRVAHGFGMYRIGVTSVDNIFDDFQVTELRSLSPNDVGKSTPMSRIYVINIDEETDDDQFKNAMRANPNIAEIENDVMCRVHASPNDPSYSQQWALYQGSRKDIHAQEAWDVETGSDAVIIAIIDSGVLYKHSDLRNNIWINPDEDIDGDRIVFDKTDSNNVDDGLNGYRDDFVGYDFFTGGGLPLWPGEDGSPKDNDPLDFNGHGTHCAGIAAAVTNNGTYGAGVAGGWGPYVGDGGVKIMALRAGYSANDGGTEVGYSVMTAVIEAINYAVNNGADVISYSAGSTNIPGMAQALSDAMNAGIVFCASAGNEDCDCPDYFGLYNGILAVGATNRYDKLWRWFPGAGTNYGNWVEICAPGEDIYSTYSNHYTPTHDILTGTSMSAPMVAGLAALIKSHHPNFDKNEIDSIIVNNGHNIDAENPAYVGWMGGGRIDAWNCLQNAASAPFDANPRIGEAPLTVEFDDQNPTAISRSWTFGDGDVSGDEDPTHIYTDPGMYDVSLEVTDPNGTCEKTRKYYIIATSDTLYGDSSTLVPVVAGHDSFPVPLYLKNTVPLTSFTVAFDWITDSGTADLDFASVSTEGTRGEDFDTAIVRAIAPTTGKVAIEFVCLDLNDARNDELAPGDGPVANLWFYASGQGTLSMDTINLIGYYYHVESRYAGDYLPEFRLMHMWTARRGDANGDGNVDSGDAVYIISYVFRGGAPPPTVYHGDANNDGSTNIADAVYLISYIFKGGPAPPP